MPVVWMDFLNANTKNKLKNHAWTFICKGKIDPKIGIEVNVLFVFILIMITMIMSVHATSSSHWKVNPVQSNVKY